MTAWRAVHDGPGGVRSSAHFTEWVHAADWVRAMMEVWQPSGVRPVMVRLARADPGTPFHAIVDRHTFAIEGQAAQGTLFG